MDNRTTLSQLVSAAPYSRIASSVLLLAVQFIDDEPEAHLRKGVEYIAQQTEGGTLTQSIFSLTLQVINNEQILLLYGSEPPTIEQLFSDIANTAQILLEAVEKGEASAQDVGELFTHLHQMTLVMQPVEKEPTEEAKTVISALESMAEAWQERIQSTQTG